VTLRGRLGLLYGSLLAVTLVVFSSLLYATLLANLNRQTDQQLRSRAFQEAERIVERMAASGDEQLSFDDIPPGGLGQRALEGNTASGVVVQVLDDRGRVLANSDRGIRAPLVPELAVPSPAAGEEFADVSVAERGRLRVVVRPIVVGARTVGTIQAGASLETIHATMRDVLWLLALGTLIALTIMTAVGWWLAGRALAPLRSITAAARAIARTGEIRERLRVGSDRDEVGQLATAFNAMIERLDEAAQRQLAFLADTSHELRSPLTVLRGNLDLLRRDPGPAARLEYLKDADTEVRRMARLVGDLLLLAQSDARQTVKLVPLALENVVREVYEQALMLAEGPAVQASCAVHAPVLGDADRLTQLLWNLVENAVRHTPADGRVDLELTVADGEAVVRIADTGVGIAAEHLPRIFERFYKVDRARSRGKSGTGLGLAIAQYLAEAHNGRLDLQSTPGVGTVATVRLPLNEP
jgi:two-component system OmpR family sensor kinase